MTSLVQHYGAAVQRVEASFPKEAETIRNYVTSLRREAGQARIELKDAEHEISRLEGKVEGLTAGGGH